MDLQQMANSLLKWGTLEEEDSVVKYEDLCEYIEVAMGVPEGSTYVDVWLYENKFVIENEKIYGLELISVA